MVLNNSFIAKCRSFTYPIGMNLDCYEYFHNLCMLEAENIKF